MKKDKRYIFLKIVHFYHKISLTFYKALLKNKFLQKCTPLPLHKRLLHHQLRHNVRLNQTDCLLIDYQI